MPFIISDLIDGNRASVTSKGWEFTRIFTVGELTAPGYAMLVEAVDFSGIVIGEPHPEIPSAKAVSIDPESVTETGNAVRLTVQYREFGQDYRVEIGSRILTTETANYLTTPNTIGGDIVPMTLDYTYPADYKTDPDKAGVLADTQGVRVDVQDYFPTIVITRTEYTTISADALSGWAVGVQLTGEILTDRGVNYNGKTNLSGWNLRPFDVEHIWRCEITATSAEDGLAYRVRYAFSYDPNLWRFNATFVDPLTGHPVPDPDLVADSEKDFDMYEAQNFSLLELY